MESTLKGINIRIKVRKLKVNFEETINRTIKSKVVNK